MLKNNWIAVLLWLITFYICIINCDDLSSWKLIGTASFPGLSGFSSFLNPISQNITVISGATLVNPIVATPNIYELDYNSLLNAIENNRSNNILFNYYSSLPNKYVREQPASGLIMLNINNNNEYGYFIFSGKNNETTFNTAIYSIDLINWKEINNIPYAPRSSLSYTKYNDSILILSGGYYNAANTSYYYDIWTYNSIQNNWNQLPNLIESTYGRAWHSSIVNIKDNYLYIIGGKSGINFYSDVLLYNFNTNKWQIQTKQAEWGFICSAEIIYDYSMNRIIVVGGMNNFNQAMNTIWQSFNDGINWSQLRITNDIWSARYRFGLHSFLNGQVIIFGGTHDFKSNQLLNDIYVSCCVKASAN